MKTIEAKETYLPLENPLARAARDSRYAFARSHLEGVRVLEAGCGARDGAVELGNDADLVVAVDVSAEGVGLAASSYARPNVLYAVMDCQRMALAPRSFDTVVSLEVIEHLPDVDAYLSEVVRVLRPGGVYIGSTPNRERKGYRPNPHHIREYIATEYAQLLRKYFESVSIYGQRPRAIVTGRGFSLRRTLTRLDVLGLRHLVPQRLKDVVNREVFHLKSARLVGEEDWDVDSLDGGQSDDADEAVVLCCVCRCSGSEVGPR
jgi:SAM-dependent methyltransferase